MCRLVNITLFFLFFMISQSINSQNLVQNSEFEDYLICPKDFTRWNKTRNIIPHWTYPSKGTPDYFNKCSKNKEVSVPNNFGGTRAAHSGKAYIGLILRGTNPLYREYVQGELKRRMIKGKIYCITFYYSISDKSKLTINHLDIAFSKKKIAYETESILKLKNKAQYTQGLFLESGSQWYKYCTYYQSSGMERYFVIGNLAKKNQYREKQIKKVGKNYCYAYIDDVTIDEIDSCTECMCYMSDLKVNLAEDSLNIILGIKGGVLPYQIKWTSYDYNNKLVIPKKKGVYEVNIIDNAHCKEKAVFSIPFHLKPKKTSLKNELEKVKIGDSITIPNLIFNSNSSSLDTSSYKQLDILSAFLLNKKVKSIQLIGHTDNVGSARYNQKLSKKRAEAVKSYLLKKGMNKFKIECYGYGEHYPIADNTTVSGRKANRRVVIKFLKE